MAMREALIAQVAPMAVACPAPKLSFDLELEARRRIAPMVQGLFVEAEQAPVLDAISSGFVLISSETIISLLHQEPDLKTAWRFAKMFRKSVGGPDTDDEDVEPVGLNQGLDSYVLADGIKHGSVFMDVIVHEAAHAFHNCKRTRLGLVATRKREWLLEIGFGMRETFAYACEAYSCIVAKSATVRDRRAQLEQLKRAPPPPDERVDHAQYLAIMAYAIEGRNGWRRILAACAPKPKAAPIP